MGGKSDKSGAMAKPKPVTKAPRRGSSAGRPRGRAPQLTKSRFGTVTVTVHRPSQAQVRKNIVRGQMALRRALPKMTTPGVELRKRKGVAYFEADPEHIDRVVRILDGKRESGVFVGGAFKVCK